MTLTLSKPFGEVITSTLQKCTLQSWNWDIHPPYGSFITLSDNTDRYAAIIHNIETVPLDTARTPTAYKKTHAELLADHPHIFSLLQTNMQCSLLGIFSSNVLGPIIRPPRIHSFSEASSEEEIKIIIQTTHYIRTLINLLEPNVADNLIYTLIAHQRQKHANQHIQAIIREYIQCIGNDYRRINNLNAHIQNNIS